MFPKLWFILHSFLSEKLGEFETNIQKIKWFLVGNIVNFDTRWSVSSNKKLIGVFKVAPISNSFTFDPERMLSISIRATNFLSHSHLRLIYISQCSIYIIKVFIKEWICLILTFRSYQRCLLISWRCRYLNVLC